MTVRRTSGPAHSHTPPPPAVYTRGGGGEGVKEGKGRARGQRRVALCRAKVIKVSHVPG